MANLEENAPQLLIFLTHMENWNEINNDSHCFSILFHFKSSLPHENTRTVKDAKVSSEQIRVQQCLQLSQHGNSSTVNPRLSATIGPARIMADK